MNKALVTTIIATLAEKKRSVQIKRAVNSIRQSSKNPVRIIVVVNGDRYDEGVCSWLKAQQDIQYEYLSLGSLPNALLFGRRMVETPYFSTLDDDDEYLPHAIDIRLDAIKNSSEIDIVVTNGYSSNKGHDSLFYSNFEQVESDPLKSLFKYNWLTNNNALFRTSSISADYFEDYHTYAEWTWLAYKISMRKKNISVLNEPTFRYYWDTPLSLSKSNEYLEAHIPLFKRMLCENPPAIIKNLIKRKMSANYHQRSFMELQNNNFRKSMYLHLKSLCLPNGLTYFFYVRKIIYQGLLNNLKNRTTNR